jgi:UDP-N-acetyl-D-galactosamine dehydrogenase
LSFNILHRLQNKEASITVIGLGYVGLPLALAFGKIFKVIGYDINKSRIDLLKNKVDPSREIASSEFEGKDVVFTSEVEDIRKSSFYIITVPTPIDVYNLPDLKNLNAASYVVGKVLKKYDYVVYESTVYPGCTEESCLPLLQDGSALKLNEDFKLGYSPERLNPGDRNHTLEKNVKVVSGSDDAALKEIGMVYAEIIKAGIHHAPSIKIAEAAKIIENTQRDVNIALMNELSLIFDKMGINTYEVLDAAATKWNFQPFKPGLVGGHCIGVDPYYLTYKAKKLGYNPNVILSGRYVNDNMGSHVAKRTMQLMLKQGKSVQDTRVLVMGATFKENVHDIRTSRVVDILKELTAFNVSIDVYDPYASAEEFRASYSYELSEQPGNNYDAIIVAVAHNEFVDLNEEYFLKISADKPVLIDVKGIFRNRIKDMLYWSL